MLLDGGLIFTVRGPSVIRLVFHWLVHTCARLFVPLVGRVLIFKVQEPSGTGLVPLVGEGDLFFYCLFRLVPLLRVGDFFVPLVGGGFMFKVQGTFSTRLVPQLDVGDLFVPLVGSGLIFKVQGPSDTRLLPLLMGETSLFIFYVEVFVLFACLSLTRTFLMLCSRVGIFYNRGSFLGKHF